MADEVQVIGGIDWQKTFPFTNIFRSFRIAVHPSKLLLGMALLLSIYFGGRILDSLWPRRSCALPDEIGAYERISRGIDRESFADWRDQTEQELENRYAQQLVEYGIAPAGADDTTRPDAASRDSATDVARRHQDVEETKDAILKQLHDHVEQIKANQYPTTQDRDAAIAAAYADANVELAQLNAIRGIGLFATFFDYEVQQAGDIVYAAATLNWLGVSGVVEHVRSFLLVGPVWLIWHHTVFFILFGALFLLAWSLFGGAISRLAAVHATQDDKISLRQAMSFAVAKILSFASAPVIPILIIALIGLALSAAALIVGWIPILGPVAIGGLFIVPLLGGFVMTLVLLGMAGGFGLMYPTISVEGSDSFDAISRSFSYVYARPWRLVFYTLVALTYGAATYLFVHTFLWFMLALTHRFIGLGIVNHAQNTQNLFSVMWPGPAPTGELTYRVNWIALSAGQSFGALLLQCWVMLVISFLGAYAISFYFSANTIIYLLMRGIVDETEMDAVYLEQGDDELEPLTTAATITVVAAADTSDAPTPEGTTNPPPAPPPPPPPAST